MTLGASKAHWIEVLTAAGVPTGPIQNVAEVMQDPQILARNMVVDVLDADGTPRYTAAGNPIKMSGLSDPKTRKPSPALDGDRAAILRWLEAQT